MDSVSSNFEAVWHRVSSTVEKQPANTGDAAIIAGLIAAEVENERFYSKLSARHTSSCTSLFNALHSASSKRLRRLQSIHFFICGNAAAVRPVLPERPQSILSALLEAYKRETDTTSRLITAIGSISERRFRNCLESFLPDAAKNAECIMHIVEQIMH